MVKGLIDRIQGFQNRLRRGATVNVNDRETKTEAIGSKRTTNIGKTSSDLATATTSARHT
jgi:hypothetical protein